MSTKTTTPPPAGKSKGGGLEATFNRHKVPILAGAAILVAGFAYLTSKSSSSSSSSPTYTGEGQVAGTSGYDSTASDVYNAIQPQLEYLARLYEQQQSGTSPTPVPTDPTTPTTPDEWVVGGRLPAGRIKITNALWNRLRGTGSETASGTTQVPVRLHPIPVPRVN